MTVQSDANMYIPCIVLRFSTTSRLPYTMAGLRLDEGADAKGALFLSADMEYPMFKGSSSIIG